MNVPMQLLLLSTLSGITLCTIYIVMPDTPKKSCYNCKRLDQYLSNAKKYFTSDAELHFQRGEFMIYSNFRLIDAHNISFIGTAFNQKPSTVIKCDDRHEPVGIEFIGITYLVMKNVKIVHCHTMNELRNLHSPVPHNQYPMSVIIFNCYNISLHNVELFGSSSHSHGGRLLASNIFGKSIISNLTCSEVFIFYADTSLVKSAQSNNTLIVQNYDPLYYDYSSEIYYQSDQYYYNDPFSHSYENEYLYRHGDNYDRQPNSQIKDFTHFDELYTLPAIIVHLKQNLYGVNLQIVNTTFYILDYFTVMHIVSNNDGNFRSHISVNYCVFIDNEFTKSHRFLASMILINFITCDVKTGEQLTGSTTLNFKNNTFTKNVYEGNLINIAWEHKNCSRDWTGTNSNQIMPQITISQCYFISNKFTHFIRLVSLKLVKVVVKISGTIFEELLERRNHATTGLPAIVIQNVILSLQGPVTFHSVDITRSLIYTNTHILVTGTISCSHIKAKGLITGTSNYRIHLIGNVYISIRNITTQNEAFTAEKTGNQLYSPCYFQFYKTNDNKTPEHKIVISHIVNNKVFDINTGNVNCKLVNGSVYYEANPLVIYQSHIHLINKTGQYPLFDTGLLCHCLSVPNPNCTSNIIGPIFPGQILKLNIALNKRVINEAAVAISVKVYDEDIPESVCKVSSLLQAEQLVEKNCTNINYTVLADNTHLCKLILHSTKFDYPTVYNVRLLHCPHGFVFSKQEKRCICDKVLTSNNIIYDCDINEQTILRPTNLWITVTAKNGSYKYHINLNCPLHYCLPHSSHLNFSTPDSQCQFNRSGILCGHCQQGLSTVFGSSHCQQCSNTYLFLTVPIAGTGLVLVFLLFILNLTVTDGTINAFILYVNIVGINTPVLFPHVSSFTPAYILISLANLDLGIQTCFYNGMDDYAKMWLQLVFPFYLIFIATSLIITSRYSTTIQRLTARRALPVLVTLFLLSYTKILLIVSSVLFSYSKLISLPSGHTTMVWSVDANVPLFGVKFIVLFITCLIIFLMLVPFNMVLVFTRLFSRFSFINKFKPLIDAYQGPYKDKMYYWVGLQLALRAVYFALSSLDRNINLTVSIVLFSLVEGMYGAIKPFKNEMKNYQEQIFNVNILILFVIALYNQTTTNTIAVNVMIGLAMGHFSLIVMYHIVTYVLSGDTRDKLQLYTSTLTELITRQRKKPGLQQFDLHDNIRIPEAVNYREYREPLVLLGHD